MQSSTEPFWPYEQRFELTVSGNLFELSDAAIATAVNLAGASIIKEGRSPSCRHFILSMSSLIIFEDRLVLISCARQGIVDAAEYLLQATKDLSPLFASLDVRAPLGVGVQSPTLPSAPAGTTLSPVGSAEGATRFIWTLGSEAPHHQTLVILLHDLTGETNLAISRTWMQQLFPELLFSGVQFDESGFSFNAVGSSDYVTVHYSGGTYASIEASFVDPACWERLDGFLERCLSACRPEIVAPMWHGTPFEETAQHHISASQTPR